MDANNLEENVGVTTPQEREANNAFLKSIYLKNMVGEIEANQKPNPNLPHQTYTHPFAKAGQVEREHRHIQTLAEARGRKVTYDTKPIAKTTANGSVERPSLDVIEPSSKVMSMPIRKMIDERKSR